MLELFAQMESDFQQFCQAADEFIAKEKVRQAEKESLK